MTLDSSKHFTLIFLSIWDFSVKCRQDFSNTNVRSYKKMGCRYASTRGEYGCKNFLGQENEEPFLKRWTLVNKFLYLSKEKRYLLIMYGERHCTVISLIVVLNIDRHWYILINIHFVRWNADMYSNEEWTL